MPGPESQDCLERFTADFEGRLMPSGDKYNRAHAAFYVPAGDFTPELGAEMPWHHQGVAEQGRIFPFLSRPA